MSLTKAQQKQREEVKAVITTNSAARHKAVLYLWKHGQTPDEQRHGNSYYYNGAGFNNRDSRVLSSLAQLLYCKRVLKEYQERELIARLPKYWSQVHVALREEIQAMQAAIAEKPVQQRLF